MLLGADAPGLGVRRQWGGRAKARAHTAHAAQTPHLPSAARSCRWLKLGREILPFPQPSSLGSHSISTSSLGQGNQP